VKCSQGKQTQTASPGIQCVGGTKSEGGKGGIYKTTKGKDRENY